MAKDLVSVFDQKYLEFCEDLKGALPEIAGAIDTAAALSTEARLTGFMEKVLPHCKPQRDAAACPGMVLPDVVITEELWASLSEGSQKAIQEQLTILSVCSLTHGTNFADLSGNVFREWTEEFTKTWKEKLNSVDFEGMSKKLADLLKGLGPDKFPKLPERFLKGQIAKLAEELVREFKPEDFGLSTEELQACDKDPSKAMELLTEIYTKKPEVLQKAIQRIAGRLQEKIRRGELRPEQIASEAEELIKEFGQNNAFKDMLESFRSVFGMEDPDLARQVGREGEARRSIVRDRLRKKLEQRKGGKK